MKDLQDYDNALRSALVRRYGTINNYRKIKGFMLKEKPKILTKDLIISVIRKVVHENGAIPSSTFFYKKGSSPNINTIINHFGSYHRALVSAGFYPKEG
jgi:hypothetical protein